MATERDDAFLDSLESTARMFLGAAPVRQMRSLSVKSGGAGGFEMSAMAANGRYALTFGGWGEEFESPEAARDYFEAALRGEARLRLETLGGRPWRWTLERLNQDGQWVPQSTITHAIWRFWGRRETRYLVNAYEVATMGGAARVARTGSGGAAERSSEAAKLRR